MPAWKPSPVMVVVPLWLAPITTMAWPCRAVAEMLAAFRVSEEVRISPMMMFEVKVPVARMFRVMPSAGVGGEGACAAAVLYLLAGGELEAGVERLEGGKGVGDAGTGEAGVGGAGVGQVGQGGVVGGAAAAARWERALDGDDDGVVLVGGVQEEDGALTPGDDVRGGDVRRHAEGGYEGRGGAGGVGG